MKKILKSRWLYVFLFTAGVIMLSNVVMTAIVKKNINQQRAISSMPMVIDTKTVYEKPEKSEAANQIKVEENKEDAEEEPKEVEEAEEGFEMPLNGRTLNEFSGNDLVYSQTLKEFRVHKGIDIAAPMLSQVKACASGVVESVKKDTLMGITVVIDHQNGFKSVYSNLSSEVMVTEGSHVKQGDIINGVGDTALIETGEESHLHFELIKDGIQVNPKEYFN